MPDSERLDRTIADALRAEAATARGVDADRLWARVEESRRVRTRPRWARVGVPLRAMALVAAGVLVVLAGERMQRTEDPGWSSSTQELDSQLETLVAQLPAGTVAAVRESLGALDSGIAGIEARLADAGDDRAMLEERIEDYHRRRHDLLRYVVQQAADDALQPE